MTNQTPEYLTALFKELKAILASYEKYFNYIQEMPGRYALWNKKDLVVLGKKKKEIYFCGLIIQSSYVGFYYMPVYAEQDQKRYFSPTLLKRLKGKSCFHLQQINEQDKKDIRFALDQGIEMYRENGWID